MKIFKYGEGVPSPSLDSWNVFSLLSDTCLFLSFIINRFCFPGEKPGPLVFLSPSSHKYTWMINTVDVGWAQSRPSQRLVFTREYKHETHNVMEKYKILWGCVTRLPSVCLVGMWASPGRFLRVSNLKWRLDQQVRFTYFLRHSPCDILSCLILGLQSYYFTMKNRDSQKKFCLTSVKKPGN